MTYQEGHTRIPIPWEELGFAGDSPPNQEQIQTAYKDIEKNVSGAMSKWADRGAEARSEDMRRAFRREITDYDFMLRFDKDNLYLDIFDNPPEEGQWGYLWFGNTPASGDVIRSTRGVGGYYTEYNEKRKRTIKKSHKLYLYSKAHNKMIWAESVKPIGSNIIETFQSDVISAIKQAFSTYEEEEEYGRPEGGSDRPETDIEEGESNITIDDIMGGILEGGSGEVSRPKDKEEVKPTKESIGEESLLTAFF